MGPVPTMHVFSGVSGKVVRAVSMSGPAGTLELQVCV
jgi:hypothetical protein